MVRRPEGVEFWLGVVSDVELASIVGCCANTIRNWRTEIGAKSFGKSSWARYKNPKYAEFAEKVTTELLRCQSANAVAKRFGCSRQHVVHTANKLGVVCKKKWMVVKALSCSRSGRGPEAPGRPLQLHIMTT